MATVDPPLPDPSPVQPKRAVFSWALYDWANHGFVTTVMAGFFPIFYKSYWRAEADPTESTFELATYNSFAGAAVALLAPVLGAIADRGGAKKRLLLFFAAISIAACAGLFFVEQGHYRTAGFVFTLAVFGYLAANIFSDSMVVDMARGRSSDRVSALGFAMGYLGGGLLFAFNVLLTLQPHWFGIPDKATAVRISFLLVAVWWILFSIPFVLFVKEPRPVDQMPWGRAIVLGWRQLVETFHHVRKLRPVLIFLVAYWLYIDAVNTIVVMAVDYGQALNFSADTLIKALLMVQFIGFPAAIAFGRIGDWIGTRNGIYLGLAVYTIVSFYGSRMTSENEFYILAGAIGLVQGGVQSLSRSFYSRLIPQDKPAEFFGFYNMLGRFATILGPLLMGVAGRATGDPRSSIIALAGLFLTGGIVLAFVQEKRAAA